MIALGIAMIALGVLMVVVAVVLDPDDFWLGLGGVVTVSAGVACVVVSLALA